MDGGKDSCVPAAATSKHASPAKKSRLPAPAIVETTLAPGIGTPWLSISEEDEK